MVMVQILVALALGCLFYVEEVEFDEATNTTTIVEANGLQASLLTAAFAVPVRIIRATAHFAMRVLAFHSFAVAGYCSAECWLRAVACSLGRGPQGQDGGAGRRLAGHGRATVLRTQERISAPSVP
jgi:hypothetical protein